MLHIILFVCEVKEFSEMGDWDKSLKTLVVESPQAFAEWIMKETLCFLSHY